MAIQGQTIHTTERDPGQALVVVFLRGGADGLHMVVPHGDDGYYRARPTIALKKEETFDLDGFFGFNPHLKPLHRWWKDGAMAVVHAAGSEDETRSHFEAQDLMEHGGIAAGGWLARFLRARPALSQSPLTAVALGSHLPEVLRGAPSCAAIQSLDDFGLGDKAPAGFTKQLAALYGGSSGVLGQAGADALAALARIETMRGSQEPPSNGAVYASNGFSGGLRQIARLIKGRVGLQAATIDLNGWDSHLTQGTSIDGQMTELAVGLDAFATDLGPAELARTTIVVMTEFGRRVAENSAAGTDHGHGSAMLVLGGGVAGGAKVKGAWPGLTPENLTGPGDLPVRTNYRDVLAPILRRLEPGIALQRVFPDHAVDPVALFP